MKTGSSTFSIILPRRGIGKDAIRKFDIGYAPPYSDEQHRGRALDNRLSPPLYREGRDFR
jgi:DNA primase